MASLTTAFSRIKSVQSVLVVTLFDSKVQEIHFYPTPVLELNALKNIFSINLSSKIGSRYEKSINRSRVSQ
jgi:hypothetical protein